MAFKLKLTSIGWILGQIIGRRNVTVEGVPLPGEVLTCILGTAVVATSYQWTRNGANIASATASTYTLTNTDIGTNINCLVNGSLTNQQNLLILANPDIDTTPPSLTSAAIADATPTIVNLLFSETLDLTATLQTAAFAISGKTVSAVAFSGSNGINVTVSVAFVSSDTPTVTYTKPGTAGNQIKDPAGNATATFGPSAITNNVSPVAQQLRYGSTQNRAPSGQTSNATRDRMAFRQERVIGSGDQDEMIIGFSGWYQAFGSTTGETAIPNDYTLTKFSVETPSGNVYPITADGSARAITVAGGIRIVMTYRVKPADVGLSKFTPGETYWFKGWIQLPAVNNQVPVTVLPSTEVTGRQFLTFTSATILPDTQVDSPGVFTWTGTAPQINTVGNLFMVHLCKYVSGDPATHFFIGDSLYEGLTCTSTDSHGRGLAQASIVDADRVSNPKSSANFGISGISTLSWLANTHYSYYAGFAKNVNIHLGTNDLGNTGTTATAATTTTRLTSLRQVLRPVVTANGGKMMEQELIPRASASSDSYATVAGQTIPANLDLNQRSMQVNADMNNFALTSPPDVVSASDLVRASTNKASTDYCRWAVDGTAFWSTTDGTHYNNRTAALVGAQNRAIFATY